MQIKHSLFNTPRSHLVALLGTCPELGRSMHLLEYAATTTAAMFRLNMINEKGLKKAASVMKQSVAERLSELELGGEELKEEDDVKTVIWCASTMAKVNVNQTAMKQLLSATATAFSEKYKRSLIDLSDANQIAWCKDQVSLSTPQH